MCDQPKERKQRFGFAALTTKRRLKLWEIKAHFHCPILGTCLSMEDLRKVMRQSGMILERRPSDYELHAIMAAAAEERGRASRNLHKMLDRKHQRWIKMLSQCKCEDKLKKHWRAAMDSGDIASAFWSVMSHPHATPDLIQKAFEDVHMLSHLQGASNRADLKRMKVLEMEVTELRKTLGSTRLNHNEQIIRRDELMRCQEQELLALMARSSSLDLEENDAGSHDETRRQNQVLVKRADWAEEQLAEREMRFAGLKEEIVGLKELLDEAREEHAAMERTMTLLLAGRSDGETEQGCEIDLRGKRILYVGGRSQLAPHLRSLVEAHNGRFDHHDGGLEDSRAGLQCTLAGADMVFCPVDCISHDACLRVKRHCRQQAKQFIPLRSSGLSAFAAGLRQFSGAESELNPVRRSTN